MESREGRREGRLERARKDEERMKSNYGPIIVL